jgi:hypothetical protein
VARIRAGSFAGAHSGKFRATPAFAPLDMPATAYYMGNTVESAAPAGDNAGDPSEG